ncbi:MAG: acetate kinase [Candidatus Paceibacteria bacterium]|jgi:acetate kinase
MGTTLVVNPGSSSRKYSLYIEGRSVLEIRFEQTGTGFEVCSQITDSQQNCESVKEVDFTSSILRVSEEVRKYLAQNSPGKTLEKVAVRVVAPGTFFQHHAEVNEEYLHKLQKHSSSAPLHIPIIVSEIQNIQKYFPGVRIVAASDSAFHNEMPPRAREYSIASEDTNKFDIHRFGYHGLSVASITRRIHALIGQDPERMIVCHIGNATSVTAIKNGKGVETTMGFSPSSGLPMGSRAGDIDAAALLELMRVKNLRPSEAEMYINTRGGLSGMAEDSDIRILLDRRSKNDAVATHALDVFAYNIQKAIAAQTVALGGLDVIVLTATASTRSSELRSLVLQGLSHLGVQVSKDRNDLLVGKDGVISVRNSVVKAVVMRTDEMGEMALVADQFNS